ncbi:MAG: 50S ribosomal protein L13 [Candidatus Auribacterota bacterium]|jgi:large subunit ribosomal protein L13|nr:50S ribosomal protein L13 [Candidatus Auribacterota bacterium]
MKTYTAKPTDIERKWYLIDATDQILGRLATKAADILRGKHKPMYTPSMDTGDYIIIINAEKVRVTGKKADTMEYQRFSGYPDGLKIESYKQMKVKKPEYIVQHAIAGMVPKTKLGKAMIKKLKVFAGPEHDHVAQKPEQITV